VEFKDNFPVGTGFLIAPRYARSNDVSLLYESLPFCSLHFYMGSRGPQPKLSLHKIFNSILKFLYLGCQWKELPIEKNQAGQPEIHYTRI
jgi:hypothetical protein